MRFAYLSVVALTATHVQSLELSFSLNGPNIRTNFPDPSLIHVGDKWYAFGSATPGSKIHVQIAESKNFVDWKPVNNKDGSERDALPDLPKWVNHERPDVWAPTVIRISDTRFVLYYSATSALGADARFHCISYAVASNILGPYIPVITAEICPISEGGAIDAQAFKDINGQRYIAYKIDGNSIGNGGDCYNMVEPIIPTPIMLQKIASDGTTFQGPPVKILDNLGISDAGIVEAPSITRSAEGVYFLFFSNGCYTFPSYTVSYATSKRIGGPYVRNHVPLLKTGDYHLLGPGSASVSVDGVHMLFHSVYGDPKDFVRAMYSARLKLEGHTARIV